jgi:PAS domain S-box-containing protein
MNSGDYMKLIPSNSQSGLQAKEELQFAHFLINQAEDAALCLDANARILYVNDATCRMSEYSREELLSMSIQEIDVDLSPQLWAERWQYLKSHGRLTFKSRYLTKNRQMFLVKITIAYIQYQGRELGCAFARDRSDEVVELSVQQYTDKSKEAEKYLQQEVAEYKRVTAEFEASVSLLRSTLESTANGIYAVNFEGDILCINKKFMEMWGLPSSVAISRQCNRAKVFFESQVKDPQMFRSCFWEMSSQCDRESYDLVELKDGRIFAHYSEPQRLGDKIIGRVWSVWDITEFKRTEQALKLNATRFRTLAETTDASIFLIQGTQLCYVNPAAQALTGYSKQELLSGFNLEQLIKGKRLRTINKQDNAALCEYQEIEILTKDGTERWLACTVEILDGGLDFAGKAVQLVTAIDITDYKQAESEVRLALEQAKQLSEMRERFVSMLCHQFRTPLNVVSFSADLLRRHINQWSEEKNLSYLDLIQLAVREISQLLDDILLFGKAEAAKLDFHPKLLDLEQFCRDVASQMQLASGLQKSINFVSAGNCTTAYLDPKLLQHILTNLLSNAIKYSPPTSTVTLQLCCEGEDLIFQIKDAGIGIPSSDRQRIFEPFYRGSNVDSLPGTGLGLSIVKTLVELHGGEINVETEVGVGTTFTVVFPNKISGF